MQTPLSGITPQPKKICWLENGDILGGAELFGLEMIGELSKNFSQEVEIHYLHNGNHLQLIQEISTVQQSLPDYITLTSETFDLPCLSGKNVKTLKSFLLSILNLRKKLQQEKYDIVYANTVRTGVLLRSAGILLGYKPTKIFFAHDYTFPPRIQKIFLSWFDKIFSCSYPVKNFLIQQGISSSDITVIENGVDIASFSRLKKIKSSVIRLGVLGRITEWKGHLTVLKAIYHMMDIYPQKKIQCDIYGEPSNKVEDQEFYIRLKHFVSENKLEKIVSFKGFVPALKALKSVDILIHAAQESEPFGRTPLEGAASNTPLLLSRMGTPAQIFTDQQNALFFEPKNKKDLAEKIITLVDDQKLQEKISKNAQQLVVEKFSIENIGNRFWKNIL